jgi:hypothetical protein
MSFLVHAELVLGRNFSVTMRTFESWTSSLVSLDVLLVRLLVKESHGTNGTEKGLLLSMLPLVNVPIVFSCKFFGADGAGVNRCFPKMPLLLMTAQGTFFFEGFPTRVTDEGSGVRVNTNVRLELTATLKYF